MSTRTRARCTTALRTVQGEIAASIAPTSTAPETRFRLENLPARDFLATIQTAAASVKKSEVDLASVAMPAAAPAPRKSRTRSVHAALSRNQKEATKSGTYRTSDTNLV